MKKDIPHIIEGLVPAVTIDDQIRVWNGVETHINNSMPIHSPFIQFFQTRKRFVTLALFALLILGSGATIVTAESTRPGDALFPLEQAIEHVRIKMRTDNTAREQLALMFAEERLTELRSIVDEKKGSQNVTDPRVSQAVSALVRVMDESNMSATAQEQLYTNLFSEISSLNINVQVGEKSNFKKSEGRVKVRREEKGSKIEITTDGVRTRIEKRNGEVRIEEERFETRDEKEMEEVGNKNNSIESGEVRGIVEEKKQNYAPSKKEGMTEDRDE